MNESDSSNGTLPKSQSPFSAFAARFCAPASQTSFKGKTSISLPADIPEALVAHWRADGFGSYDETLIWTQPPSKFEAVIEEWTGSNLNDAALVVRFSFGDFVMWTLGRVYFINVHRGVVDELPGDLDFVFEELLCDDTFLDNFLRRPLHRECIRKLGNLSAEECFAFVPALALGGKEAVESVQRVPLCEHLAFLAELHGPLALG